MIRFFFNVFISLSDSLRISFKTSWLCSPKLGPGKSVSPGVFDSLGIIAGIDKGSPSIVTSEKALLLDTVRFQTYPLHLVSDQLRLIRYQVSTTRLPSPVLVSKTLSLLLSLFGVQLARYSLRASGQLPNSGLSIALVSRLNILLVFAPITMSLSSLHR